MIFVYLNNREGRLIKKADSISHAQAENEIDKMAKKLNITISETGRGKNWIEFKAYCDGILF